MQENSPVDVPAGTISLLLPVKLTTIQKEEVRTVSARALYSFLESKQDFTTWIKRRIAEYNFIEGEDYLLHKTVERGENGNPPSSRHEYDLTLEMGKEVAMVEKTQRGKEVRQYFIACEKQAKCVAPHLPTTRDPFQTLQLHYDVLAKHDIDIKSLTNRADQAEEVALEAVAKSELAVTTVDDFLATRTLTHTQCYEVRLAVEKKKQQLTEKYSIPSGGTIYSGLYSFLKHHFKVNTYTGIPAARFDEAMMIINNITMDQLPDNVKNAVPKPKAKTRKGGAK